MSDSVNINYCQYYSEAYKKAEQFCEEQKIGYVLTELVLYYGLQNAEFESVLLTVSSYEQTSKAKRLLNDYLGDSLAMLRVSEEEMNWISDVASKTEVVSGNFDLEVPPHFLSPKPFVLYLSPMFSQVADQAIVNFSGTTKGICFESFMLSILSTENCVARDILENCGFSAENMRTLLNIPEPQKNNKDNPIEKFCVNVFQKIIDKKPVIVGREVELLRMAEVFSRKEKNNIIISGPSGVGKSSIIEKMIMEMNEKKFLSSVNKNKVLSLDMGALLAGTKFRGDFEERMDALTKAIVKVKKGVVLVLENIHLCIGNGSANGMDIAHFLTEMLSNNNIKIIGTTTQESWRKIVEENKSFARFFEKLEVAPPSEKENLEILKVKIKDLENFHKVLYSKVDLNSLIQLSNKYLPKRVQPDSSIDVLDRAGAKLSLKIQKTLEKVNKVSDDLIQETIAEISKTPNAKVNNDESKVILDLANKLNSMVFGQNEAIEKIHESLIISKSGLRESQKTIGSFLFLGSTGVGKTEVAKSLAQEMTLPFLRFDMSEYSESHSISKLIGSPPGYVGYGKGGLLSEAIDESPYAVVLIDELEKAHPEIFNIFLQIMDNGSFKDSQGRVINCQNIILIMTSNLGAGEMSKKTLGLGLDTYGKKIDTAKFLTTQLKPEFINRFDSIVNFNKLSKEEFVKILNKHIDELNKKISKHNLKIELEDNLCEFFITKSISENMGARPLKRLIESNLKSKLAMNILEGRKNQVIKAFLKDNTVEFEYTSVE